MSATMSLRHSGMVLMAFHTSFLSSSVFTVPTKWSLPSFSCALPSNRPFAVEMAYAYLSRSPMIGVLLFQEVQVTFLSHLSHEREPVAFGADREPAHVSDAEPAETREDC